MWRSRFRCTSSKRSKLPQNVFPDPERLAELQVYDLLHAAAEGHVGIDRRFLHAIVDRGAEAIPGLVKFGAESSDEPRVDLEEEMIGMFRHLKTPEAIPYFIECIRCEPRDVPDHLVEAILPLGAAALEPLLGLYNEIGEEDGSDVAFLLASLQVRDPRILSALTDRLEYDAADGAFCLGLYGDPGAIPALEKMLAEIPDSEALLRRDLRFAIEEIDTYSADSGEEQEHPAFDLFEDYPDKLLPPTDVLSESERVAMLDSPAADYRVEAVESFRYGKLEPAVRTRLLQAAKADPDVDVRAKAWEGLAEALDDPGIREAMRAVLDDENADLKERSGALVGLAESADDPAIAARIGEFYERPATRASALEAMWRSFDRRFAPYFPKHLDDADDEVKRQAVWGMAYLGAGADAGRLREMFNDADFRVDALFAYAMCMPAEISRGRIRGLLRRIDESAGGLSIGEMEIVKMALDQRLERHGFDPVFAEEDEEDLELEEEEYAASAPGPTLAPVPKVGRNDPCPCGSGKKYKKCHGA
jgi:HEAT repeat protein